MKRSELNEEYEGDLWVAVNEQGMAVKLFTEEPSLEVKQEFVGGYIEYAHVVKNAVAPLPMPSGSAKMCRVVSVVVDEEGLLKNKTPNTIATWAAYQEPFGSETQHLVGSAIIHMKVSKDDEMISFSEMLRIVSGQPQVDEGFWLHGIQHFADKGVPQ